MILDVDPGRKLTLSLNLQVRKVQLKSVQFLLIFYILHLTSSTGYCIESVFPIPQTFILDNIANPPHVYLTSQATTTIHATILIPALNVEETHIIIPGESKDVVLDGSLVLTTSGTFHKTVIIRGTG